MHQLNRPTAPACLARFRYGKHNWSDLSPTDKQEIWCQLNQMQGQRCAYCESPLQSGEAHIEHFQQRHRYPQGTFNWNNLFGSCNRNNSCGKHKDQCQYDPQDLIKPDIEDPERLLQFLSDGRIVPRAGLAQTDLQRAQETLRVFNLDHARGPLRQMRQSTLHAYKQQAEELLAMAECFPDEFYSYLQQELAAIAGEPFTTAIKHFLIGV